MDNLELYNKFRVVPEGAQKKISGGRLSGMTDINPMWRIKVLTETFGACGIGWKYEIEKVWLDPGANDEIAAFAIISLYIKQNDKWSEKIPGIGGSGFVSKERGGLYTNDECFKMAVTDAVSVACKSLGIGADVYWQNDRTKYTGGLDGASTPTSEPRQSTSTTPDKADPILKCTACGAIITIAEHDFSCSKFKKPLCRGCQKKV